MTYKELQEKAQSLGLPFVGLNEKSLRKSIEKAEKSKEQSPKLETKIEENEKVTAEENVSNEEGDAEVDAPKKDDEVKKDGKVSVAIVKNGKYEVRRYSLQDHGKNFKKLASEFADKKKYEIELVTE